MIVAKFRTTYIIKKIPRQPWDFLLYYFSTEIKDEKLK